MEEKLAAYIVSDDQDSVDRFCWAENLDGTFSIKTAYNLSTGLVHDEGTGLWNMVWGLKIPNRIRAFLWLVLQLVFINQLSSIRLLNGLIPLKIGSSSILMDACEIAKREVELFFEI